MNDGTLLQRLEGIVVRIQAIDIRGSEGNTSAAIYGQILTPLAEIVVTAVGLLADARRRYPERSPVEPEQSCEDSSVFALQIDGAMDLADTRSRIVDVVVLGGLELACKHAALRALGPDSDPWTLIDVCASARRRTLKVVIALLHAICSHHGIANNHALNRSELEISLEIRRVYTRFRGAVLRIPAPGPEDVNRRLREAGILIAKLIGREIYDFIRTSDRRQLRAVQERVLAWLRSPDPPPRLGIRIWQDFAALAGVLVQVNHRAELRDHDLAVASELWKKFATASPSAPIGAPALAQLGRLYGRDDELDSMLDADPSAPWWVFHEPLQRILQLLDSAESRTAGDGGALDDAL